jgi:NADH-quinone oxidoreductase subunit G
LRALAASLSQITGAALGYLTEGANAAGAALAGAQPHRRTGGKAVARAGADVQAMLDVPRSAYILFGIEPSKDLAEGAKALTALRAAAVVCFTPYVSDELLDCADILLPTATFAETAGTFVNVEGRWQSFDAAADLVGESRPGWRVLRVLGNELELPDCEYQTPSDIVAAIERELGGLSIDMSVSEYRGSFSPAGSVAHGENPELDLGIYAVDAVVRRSSALQETVLGRGVSA